MDPILNPEILANFNPVSIGYGLLKILYMTGFALYVAFAIVVVSQIKQMTSALNGMLELPLRLFSWIHLLVAVIAFLLALVIL